MTWAGMAGGLYNVAEVHSSNVILRGGGGGGELLENNGNF